MAGDGIRGRLRRRTSGSGSGGTSPGEPTHLGKRFDDAVRAVVGRQRPVGEDPGYDLVRRTLDVGHYLLQAAHLHEMPQAEPIRNLLRQGAKARVSPEINFSTAAYLQRHPERATETSPYLAWLREGRAAGEIADPAIGLEKMAGVLGLTPRELADELGERRTDLQQRLRQGRLGEVWAKAAEIEPLVGEAWIETTRPKMTPLPIAPVAHQVAALHDCHRQAGFRPARVVLVVGAWPHEYAAGLVETLLERVPADEVLVLVTDEAVASGATGTGVPVGVRLVDLAGAGADLNRDQSQLVLVQLLRSLDAESIVGSRSEALLGAMTPYGKALRATERIHLTLEPLVEGLLGASGDALRFYYRHLDVAAGFLATDPGIADLLAHTFQSPQAARALVHPAYDAPTRRAAVAELLTEEVR